MKERDEKTVDQQVCFRRDEEVVEEERRREFIRWYIRTREEEGQKAVPSVYHS